MLTAAVFTAIFEGLVAFVGESPAHKTHAAIVSAAHHQAYVLVNGGFVRLEKGDIVTFDLPAGTAATTESFDRRVPNLSEYLLAGDLHDDVKDQTHPNDGVLAFVTLAEGTLSAEGGFTHPAVFQRRDGGTDTRCIARSVRFTADVARDVTVTIDGPSRRSPAVYVVPTGGEIYIGNVSTAPGMHFHAFSGLLNKRGRIGATSERSAFCSDDGALVERPRGKELRFPIVPFLPNGDCGPVDYP